jgi:hypothetical protein
VSNVTSLTQGRLEKIATLLESYGCSYEAALEIAEYAVGQAERSHERLGYDSPKSVTQRKLAKCCIEIFEDDLAKRPLTFAELRKKQELDRKRQESLANYDPIAKPWQRLFIPDLELEPIGREYCSPRTTGHGQGLA